MNRTALVLSVSFGLLLALALSGCDSAQPIAAPPSVQSPHEASAAASPNSAPGAIPTVHFGKDVGSPFDPASGHDHSGNAADNLVARTVVIRVNGSVRFQILPFHRVAIYDVGTAPAHIDLTLLDDFSVPPVFIPDFVINDPSGRVVEGPPFSIATEVSWVTPAGTFDRAGKYLVICEFFPHFAFNRMYGWVIVQ